MTDAAQADTSDLPYEASCQMWGCGWKANCETEEVGAVASTSHFLIEHPKSYEAIFGKPSEADIKTARRFLAGPDSKLANPDG